MKKKVNVSLKRAINTLACKYAYAIQNPGIFKPVSWALYQTWKEIDEVERYRDGHIDGIERYAKNAKSKHRISG